MKLTVTLDNFPMALASKFNDELHKYAEVAVAFAGKGTASVHMDSTNIVKIQEICIVCDKYSIGADADISEKFD